MCNLPRSREDRIAIHSDHSHTQRRPHCHSYRSASPTSEQHLHLEPSPSSRLQPPHTMAHERGACTRHDPKIPSVVRTSNSPDSDLVSSSTRTACPQAWLKPAQPQTNRIVRTVYTALLSQDATHNGAARKRSGRVGTVHDRTSPKSLLVNFRLCVRYHPHKFLRQSGLGLHSTPSPSRNVRVLPP